MKNFLIIFALNVVGIVFNACVGKTWGCSFHAGVIAAFAGVFVIDALHDRRQRAINARIRELESAARREFDVSF